MVRCRFLVLVMLSLLVACGPTATPEAVQVELPASPSPTNRVATLRERATDDTGSAGSATDDITSREMATDDGETDTGRPAAEASPTSGFVGTPSATDPGGRQAVFPNTIVVYRREGRFPNSPQKWTIYHTGRIVAGDGSELQASEQEVGRLFEILESSDFWNLADEYAPDGECVDCTVHTLTVYYRGEIKEIRVIRETPGLPEKLELVLGQVDCAISSE